MKIKIDPLLKEILPDFKVAVMHFDASPTTNASLDALVIKLEEEIEATYQLPDVLCIPNIVAARKGYKLLGKDPSRYRLAVESLYRRIVKGNALYRINTLVDLGNVLSLKTARSIAVLDEESISGDVTIRIGRDEPYEGIGRGTLNIENIPVYCDNLGPFGSPTSDTQRTMITERTTRVMVFIISFNGHTNLMDDLALAKDLYSQFALASGFSWDIINE